MKISLIIKTVGGSWSFDEADALFLLKTLETGLLAEWRTMRDEKIQPSAEFEELFGEIRKIKNSLCEE